MFEITGNYYIDWNSMRDEFYKRRFIEVNNQVTIYSEFYDNGTSSIVYDVLKPMRDYYKNTMGFDWALYFCFDYKGYPIYTVAVFDKYDNVYPMIWYMVNNYV